MTSLFIDQRLDFATQEGIELGHNGIAITQLFQLANELVPKESRIGSNSDARTGPSLWEFGHASLHKKEDAGVRGSISRTKRAVPELVPSGFKTQQGMVGTAPFLFGIVTQSSPLLFAIDGHNDRVQIKDQIAGERWCGEPFQAQAIMQADQLPNRGRRKPFEKAAQSGLIGKSLQSQQSEKGPIVLEDFSFIDPSQPGDDRVDQGQPEIRRQVGTLAQLQRHVSLETPAQFDFLAEPLHQDKPAEMCEAGILEFELKFAGACGHRQKWKKSKKGEKLHSGKIIPNGCKLAGTIISHITLKKQGI
jgi:hypothetical protein